METFLIRALQLILSLSLLVIIHEGGHFFFARLFKIRVEKFYIFFDPWFSLFKYKPKNSDTEYGVGWLPLGGYCKISGMIDESMDTEQTAGSAVGIPFQTGLAASAGNGGRSIDELPAGSVHLFHDSLYMGRPLHGLERHDNGYEVQ